jgi:hypothetical protein
LQGGLVGGFLELRVAASAQADVAVLQGRQQAEAGQEEMGNFDPLVAGVDVADQGQVKRVGAEVRRQVVNGSVPSLSIVFASASDPTSGRL